MTLDALKFVAGMVLAALVSYFGTTYGLQERISIVEVKAQEAEARMKRELEARDAVLTVQLAVITTTLTEMRDDIRRLRREVR